MTTVLCEICGVPVMVKTETTDQEMLATKIVNHLFLEHTLRDIEDMLKESARNTE